MPKPKQPKKLQKKVSNSHSLQDFFSQYDAVTLIGMINTFENGEGWKLFRAYMSHVQREYEVTALDLMGKEEPGASFASGYAKCAEDTQKDFMEGLKKTLLGVSPLVENPREEDSLL